MKVKELLAQDIDVEIVEDVTDDFCISFVGPVKLTEEGERHFAELLNVDVDIWKECDGVPVDAELQIDGPNWERLLNLAGELFYGAAGYCSEKTYEAWFEEGDTE